MTKEELDRIKNRHDLARGSEWPITILESQHDVPALVAEVERLTKELEAYKHVVNTISVNIKQAASLAAALFK